MTQEPLIPLQLRSLFDAVCDDLATAEQLHELETVLANDENARYLYLDYCSLHVDLHFAIGGQQSQEAIHEKVRKDAAGSPKTVVPPIPILLSTTLPSTIGWFSSGWPVAYLVATLIFGLGLLVGSHTYVSQPAQVARQSSVPSRAVVEPKMELVGRITGMVDCQWLENPKSEIRNPKSFVSLGDTFALSSGLMEITYDTGAKVILQGPVTYEVESSDGGYLAVGKLTARLEKNDERGTLNAKLSDSGSSFIVHRSSFVVRTPSATVTDLGTEFGVEVGKGDKVEVHVLQGVVTVQQSAHKDGTPKPMRVTQGQAVQIEPNRAVFTAVAYMPSAFVRSIGARGDGNSSPSLGGAYSKAVLSDHPVAYYRLNETAGHNMANASGGRQRGDLDAIYVNFGTGVGAGNLGQAGPRPTDLVEGRPLLGFESNSRAPDFKPSMLTRVQRANRGTGDALNVTGALSLEAWVYVDRYSVYNQGIVSKWWSVEEGKEIAQRSYCLCIDNQRPGSLHSAGFAVSSDGTAAGITTVHGSQAVPIGQWVHLAATFRPGRSMRVYCNGALGSIRTADVPAGIFDSAAPLWIGTQLDRTNATVYFSGRIAEAAIYNYALDDVNGRGRLDADNRVAAHYKAAFMPEPAATEATSERENSSIMNPD